MTQQTNQYVKQDSADQAIRDLMGLLALPALWAGRDGETILQLMTEAVERIVSLRFSYVHAALLPDRPAVERVRVDGRLLAGEVLRDWHFATTSWSDKGEADARAHVFRTPLGNMRVVRFAMGYGVHESYVWFGSSDPQFPSTTQLAILRAAASLAATGLQTARASYEREEASRAKDEFLAMLGHELRNPLSPIVTALKLIELKNGGKCSNEHAIIHRQVGHLRRLVDDLLDVSRITRGKVELKKAPTDIKLILERAIENARPLLEERQHTLRVNFANEETCVFGDAMRLTQVFTNLLTNAAKYTDSGGEITVTSCVQEGNALVRVRDNGSGISPRLFPRLFHIFEQGTATIDRSKGGLGIGLALVKNFVELHGGTVSAASQGIGHGSEFTVTLPLLRETFVGQANSSSKAPIATKDTRVLVVDDNVDALETMEIWLREQGYEVAIASDPLEALKLAESFRPAVAVLDIGLPVMDGYKLAEHLRKQFGSRELYLLALTGYGQASDRMRAKAAGFDEHLVKPVDLDDLSAALNNSRVSKLTLQL